MLQDLILLQNRLSRCIAHLLQNITIFIAVNCVCFYIGHFSLFLCIFQLLQNTAINCVLLLTLFCIFVFCVQRNLGKGENKKPFFESTKYIHITITSYSQTKLSPSFFKQIYLSSIRTILGISLSFFDIFLFPCKTHLIHIFPLKVDAVPGVNDRTRLKI